MKHPSLLTIAALLIAARTASPADVKIIANPGVRASTIAASELKAIFLMTKTTLGDGARVEPVVSTGGPAHTAFLKTYLRRTDAALQTYYRSLIFTGTAPMPEFKNSDAAIVAYVARTKGAIGYVAAGAATDGVKVLEVR
jgi:hypothetical protein